MNWQAQEIKFSFELPTLVLTRSGDKGFISALRTPVHISIVSRKIQAKMKT